MKKDDGIRISGFLQQGRRRVTRVEVRSEVCKCGSNRVEIRNYLNNIHVRCEGCYRRIVEKEDVQISMALKPFDIDELTRLKQVAYRDVSMRSKLEEKLKDYHKWLELERKNDSKSITNDLKKKDRFVYKKIGVCIYCNEPNDGISSYCIKHHESHTLANKRYKERLTASNKIKKSKEL
jgi:hypothetical protein